MNHYDDWARRWNLPPQALQELHAIMGIVSTHQPEVVTDIAGESRQQSLIRLDCARQGMTLFRNNVGALKNEDGRLVRYGLANDSAAFNKVIKSSDLIGWREILIRSEHVGQRVAQFASIEAKEAGWHYTGTEREAAQLKWIEQVNKAGGYARFANAPFVV